MSLLIEVVAWAVIAIGALSASHLLVALAASRARQPRGGTRDGARTARSGTRHVMWQRLRLSLYVAVMGAWLLAINSKNDTAEWSTTIALAVVVVLYLGPQVKSHMRRKSGNSTVESS